MGKPIAARGEYASSLHAHDGHEDTVTGGVLPQIAVMEDQIMRSFRAAKSLKEEHERSFARCGIMFTSANKWYAKAQAVGSRKSDKHVKCRETETSHHKDTVACE